MGRELQFHVVMASGDITIASLLKKAQVRAYRVTETQ